MNPIEETLTINEKMPGPPRIQVTDSEVHCLAGSTESLGTIGKNLLPLRVYAALLAACAIGLAAGQPYIAALSGLPVLSMILWTNAAINMAVSIPVIFLGLLAARKLGMGAPVLESLLYSKPVLPGSLRTLVLLAPLSGLAVGGALTAMDLAFHRLIPEGFAALEAASQGMTSLHPLAAIAATLYGGIYEELQLRLFVLSSMAWLYTLVLRKIQRQPFYPSSTVTTVAVVLAALMFGLAHLPALQALQAATGPMIIRTMILNLVPGLLFGFLYVKKGLEAAMISHLCADLVMHVFLPFMEGRFA